MVIICVASKIVVESGNKKKIEAKNAGLRKANCDLFYDKFHRFRGKLVVIHFRKHKGGQARCDGLSELTGQSQSIKEMQHKCEN